jgi:hypothetical protein
VNGFLDQFSQLEWWLSVVVVGIAINLASAYIKKRLDKALASASKTWRGMSEKRQMLWRCRVDHAKKSDVRLSIEIESEGRDRLRSVYFMGMSSALFFQVIFIDDTTILNKDLAKSLCLLLAVLAFFLSFHLQQSAGRAARVISQARYELGYIDEHEQ